MSAEIAAFKLLNRLEWSHLALILGLLIGARVLASATGWLITHLAERVSGRWRLTILLTRVIADPPLPFGTRRQSRLTLDADVQGHHFSL